jgi:hypothetical protein
MGPFKGVPVVTTTLHLGAQDLTTIKFGSLEPGNITASNALYTAPPGNDQKYVNGDYTEVVYGKRRTEIDQNDQLDVLQNRITNITLDHRLTVRGTERTEIHHDRHLHVFQHDIEEYPIHREINEPFLYEKKGFDGAMKGISLDTIGVDMAFKVTQVETTGVAVGGAAIELEHKELHDYMEGLRSNIAGFVDGAAGFVVKCEAEVNANFTISPDHLG